MQLQEQLSALFDNELPLEQQAAVLEEVLADQELQQQLTQFHLIRDVLQSCYVSKLKINESLV